MDPANWNRVEEVFNSAMDREPGERAAFLRDACREDGELLKEVESVLAQGSGAPFLERPA